MLCAPDSFKESLTAAEAAAAMARGVRRARPEAQVDLCPIADGGEGTVAAMLAATGGRARVARVTGPLGAATEATWGMLPDGVAVIEMAAASGLMLVPVAQRDPTRTTTFGTGELIAAAAEHGATRIVLGIGGSATTDGGCGMAQALGVRFVDHAGRVITTPLCGGDLERIASIDVSHRRGLPPITVACDVTNPLTGRDGAAYVYGPQKGATPEQVEQLDRGLRHLAEVIRGQLGHDIEPIPGSGAAGGLGGGLIAFAGATLARGIDTVLEATGFDRRVQGCALCLTGEGRLDGQSLSGKACLGVARAAARHDVPTIALVGSADDDAARAVAAGLHSYRVIAPHLPREVSMAQAAQWLERTAADVVTHV